MLLWAVHLQCQWYFGIIESEVQAEEIESQVIGVNGNVQAGEVMMQVYESEKSNARK